MQNNCFARFSFFSDVLLLVPVVVCKNAIIKFNLGVLEKYASCRMVVKFSVSHQKSLVACRKDTLLAFLQQSHVSLPLTTSAFYYTAIFLPKNQVSLTSTLS